MAEAEKEAELESSQAEARSEGELIEPTGYVRCPVEGCGEVVSAQGRYGHFKSAHPGKDYENYKEDFEIAPPPEGGDGEEKSPETPAKGTEELYETEPDMNKKLKEVLTTHPGIGEEQASEVMWWARHRGELQPTEVYNLLSNLKGVSNQTATLASQKYAAVLQSAFRNQGGGNAMPVMSGMQGVNPPQGGGSPIPIGAPQQGGNPGPLPVPQQGTSPQNTQNQGSQPITEERLREVLDEREEKKKEKEKEDWIREMITKQQQLVENLNDRLTALEKNPPSPAQGGEGGGESSGIEDYLEDLKSLKNSLDELSGEEKEKIPPELQTTLSNIDNKLDDVGTPEGKMNQYDMEVKKAQQEAEARKTEAQERRKGFEEIANAVRDLGSDIGWSIGESVARGGGSSQPGQNPNPGNPNPQVQTQGQSLYEPKPIRKKDDGTRVIEGCVWRDCDHGEDIRVEPGKSSVTCPECNRIIQIPAAE